MCVPRSVDRLRPNKDRQTCQASPRRLNTRASRSAPSSVAHPLGRVAPARLPRRCTELPLRRPANRAGIHYRKESSPGDPRAPGPSNDGATDHAPARRGRPPRAASGKLPATHGGAEDRLSAPSPAEEAGCESFSPRPPACGDELLVALSCKGRGFCPSCTTRRMHDTATHLVDRVIPHVPVRQWVLSLPRWARFLLARDPQLITRALDIALRGIFVWQRRGARRAGAVGPRTGAVTFVQRFGGALNLNVHFHCAIPDGVFVRKNGSVGFVELAPPSDDDVMAVLRRIVARLEQLLRPRLTAAQTDARPLDALGAAQAEGMHLLGTSPPQTGRATKRAAY